MIFDKLENIDKYNQIPKHAIDFIKKLNKDLKCQRYELTDTDFVNIESYYTKSPEESFFEAHKDYADIQIILSGIERLDYTDIEKLEIKTPYKKDIEFYHNTVKETCSVVLDGSNFVYFAPNEAHKPQMAYNQKSVEVKKAVVKIKV